MAADLHDAAFIKGIIHMSLHAVINCDATVSKYGLGLIAADAVQTVHDKVKQFVWLLDFTNDSFVIVARYSMVVATIGHYLNLSLKFLIKDVTQAREDAVLVTVGGLDMVAGIL